jgi:hypothetical protein
MKRLLITLLVLTASLGQLQVKADTYNLLTAQDTTRYLEWEFANNPAFAGRTLLDHANRFTLYDMHATNPPGHAFVIWFVYSQSVGYGFEKGPFHAYLMKLGHTIRFYDYNGVKLESDLIYMSATARH